MRARFGLILGLILVITRFSFADTTWVAGGDISGNWMSDGSPYMILGDLRVPPGEMLSIGPGVTVFFAVRCSLLVDSAARLEALGAEGDSVYFTTDTLALPERWKSIETDSDADSCRFEWCVFEYANAYQGCLHIQQAPLALRHCAFRQNVHIGDANALFVWEARVEITNCLFEDNHGGNGPAAQFVSPSGTIEDCVFRNNDGDGLGGAIDWFSQGDSLVLRRCHFIGNTGHAGGAVALEAVYNGLLFEDCLFLNNTSSLPGGAVYSFSAVEATFSRCWFEGNHSAQDGGALRLGTQSTLDQCVIASNSAVNGGGIILGNDNSVPTIRRCTIVGNTATGQGGGLYLNSWAMIRSTVVAFNNGAGIRVPSGASSQIRFNLLFGNTGGEVIPASSPIGDPVRHNINGDTCDTYDNVVLDPQFVDSVGDFHLMPSSPCIDAGDPQTPHDPDGTIADIGAFYYDQTQAADPERTAVQRYELSQNFPNPFNSATRIAFDLPRAGNVELSVFDITGRRVAELIHEPLTAGHHNVDFDASGLPSGVYLYHLRANGAAQTRKMVILK
jgi:hypothetical protein